MAAAAIGSSRRRGGPILRSLSPSGRYPSSPSTAFASSSSILTPQSSSFFSKYQTTPHQVRSASPTRVNFGSISPSRSISAVGSRNHQVVKKPGGGPKRTCLCSPTTHPGSFRCSLHKGFVSNINNNNHSASDGSYSASNYHRLHARRSAMTNSLVRIGGVEGGDLVKRALAALIRPSSHQQRRRADFQPRPSRLSVMSKAEE